MKKFLDEKINPYMLALGSIFLPPEFEEREETVIARLLVQFLVPLALLAPLFTAVAVGWAPKFAPRWFALLAISWLSVSTALILVRQGLARTASKVAVAEFWLIISVFSLTAGGVRAPLATGYLVLVVGAGFLLGWKAGYMTAIASVLAQTVFLYLGTIMELPGSPVQRSDPMIWVVNVFFALTVAVLQHVASHNFRGALERADRELAERKRTESSLRQSEERYSRLSQATFEGIIFSEQDIIVDINNQALSMFGCTAEEMIGRSILEFLGPTGDGPLVKQFDSGNEEPYECLAVRKNGTTFPVEMRSRLLSVDGHEVSLTTIRDITERKRADLLQNAVYRISQAQDNSENLDELYKTVHEIISTVMPANNFYIALYDEKEDIVSFPYFVDEVDVAFPPHKSGKGLTEYVIRTGKSLMCDEATDRELSDRGEIQLVGTPSTIWIGVPLKVEGKTFGVMAIQHYTDQDAYGKRDLKMLEYVSEQVARAIDRRRAADASQRERILLKTLVDNLPAPICVKNLDRRITLANPAFVRHVQMSSGRRDLDSEESILGKTDFETYPRGLAEERSRDDEKVIREGKQVLDREEFLAGPDGVPHWELVSTIPMRNEDGGVIGLVNIGTDITERKLTEEDLRQVNAFNEMLIQTFPFGIEVVDESGKILFMSELMKSLVGVDAIGQRCWEMYRDNKQQCEACPLLNHLEVGESKSIEVANMLNGRTFLINHTGLRYNGKKAMLEILQDITENKRLQAQFIQAQKLEGLGNIAAGIAHDFNNILGVILGYAEMVNDPSTPTEKIDSGLEAIIGSARRGKSLVGQLLTFARKSDSSFETVEVNEVVSEIESLLKATFPKTIQIGANLQMNLPCITADPNQLHQVLLNVCVNARDAMPSGGVLSISTSVVVHEPLLPGNNGNSPGHYVKIQISDNGVGMDAKTKSRIFEPFFSTKEVGRGTGLGLAVVYGIVESHRGFVEVESEKGKGTLFSIYFPASDVQPEKPEQKKEFSVPSSAGGETVLVIEDEPMLRELAESILISNGYEVMAAADGEQGVEAFLKNKERITAVLSDLGLPKLNGQEVVGRIRALDPSANVVIASGFISPDVRDTLENLGVKGFVQKPYRLREVLIAVRKAIHGDN